MPTAQELKWVDGFCAKRILTVGFEEALAEFIDRLSYGYIVDENGYVYDLQEIQKRSRKKNEQAI